MMIYEIRVKGQLDCQWQEWFGGMQITPLAAGETTLTGPVPDQAALYGLLKRVRDLGMPLLALNPVEEQSEAGNESYLE